TAYGEDVERGLRQLLVVTKAAEGGGRGAEEKREKAVEACRRRVERGEYGEWSAEPVRASAGVGGAVGGRVRGWGGRGAARGRGAAGGGEGAWWGVVGWTGAGGAGGGGGVAGVGAGAGGVAADAGAVAGGGGGCGAVVAGGKPGGDGVGA